MMDKTKRFGAIPLQSLHGQTVARSPSLAMELVTTADQLLSCVALSPHVDSAALVAYTAGRRLHLGTLDSSSASSSSASPAFQELGCLPLDGASATALAWSPLSVHDPARETVRRTSRRKHLDLLLNRSPHTQPQLSHRSALLYAWPPGSPFSSPSTQLPSPSPRPRRPLRLLSRQPALSSRATLHTSAARPLTPRASGWPAPATTRRCGSGAQPRARRRPCVASALPACRSSGTPAALTRLDVHSSRTLVVHHRRRRSITDG